MSRTSAVFLCVAALVAADVAYGQEQKEQKEKNLAVKMEKVQRAKFIDFADQLGLPIATLSNLGERIDTARQAADPVDLATSAMLLQAAESVSGGKKAGLTSQALTAEAIDLAKMRSNPAELTTIAKLVGGSAAADLESLAKVARTKVTGATKELAGQLYVDNHSHSVVYIYVDGYYLGHVHPHSVQPFYVAHGHTAIARDSYGHRWFASFDPYHIHRYNFVIEDPHHPH